MDTDRLRRAARIVREYGVDPDALEWRAARIVQKYGVDPDALEWLAAWLEIEADTRDVAPTAGARLARARIADELASTIIGDRRS